VFGFAGAFLAQAFGVVVQRAVPAGRAEEVLDGVWVVVDYVDRINRSFRWGCAERQLG
jgi:hypothetical protein